MLPILLLAGGAILLMSGGKKSRSSSGGGGGGEPNIQKHMELHIGQSGGPTTGKPWSRCDPPPGSPDHTYAAYNEDGVCMVFWRPDTWDAVIAHFNVELGKLSESERDALCSAENCEPDPYAIDPELFCRWTPDPKRVEFINSVITKLYPQITPDMIPPKDGDPYFVRMVYSLIAGTFVENFCGFNLTT